MATYLEEEYLASPDALGYQDWVWDDCSQPIELFGTIEPNLTFASPTTQNTASNTLECTDCPLLNTAMVSAMWHELDAPFAFEDPTAAQIPDSQVLDAFHCMGLENILMAAGLPEGADISGCGAFSDDPFLSLESVQVVDREPSTQLHAECYEEVVGTSPAPSTMSREAMDVLSGDAVQAIRQIVGERRTP